MPTLQAQRRRRSALVRAELDAAERRLAAAERGLVAIDDKDRRDLEVRAVELRAELDRLQS